MTGLQRGTVQLCDHRAEWAGEANALIRRLGNIFGDTAVDIQHIGSTAIKGVKAKPIIDIAVGVRSFDCLKPLLEPLSAIGIHPSAGQPFDRIVLFSRDDAETGNRLNNIQVVIYGEEHWNKHILFRDYLNAHPDKAAEYEKIKLEAAALYPADVRMYSACKSAFILECICAAAKEP